jgi:cysteine-rich repeat protein
MVPMYGRLLWLSMAVVAVTGCAQEPVVYCDDDTICPLQTTCVKIVESKPYVCATTEQTIQCQEPNGLPKANRTPCTIGNEVGSCQNGFCLARECGDGIVDDIEVCDDGNSLDKDGCSALCDSKETCGNGVVDLAVGEQCDDITLGLAGDGCSSKCQREQANWAPVPIKSDRFSRRSMAFAYDSARKELVIFGGVLSNELDDTLIFDGAKISTKQVFTHPSARRDAAMAYDSVRRRIVLFGGRDGFENKQDTWEWDGIVWKQILGLIAVPPATVAPRMVFDPVKKSMLLLTHDEQSTSTSLWSYDGVAWRETSQGAIGPTARDFASIAYDSKRALTVVFGGLDVQGLALNNEVWEWNSRTSTWRKSPFTGPGPRQSMAMVYDDNANMMVGYGGLNNGTIFRETWIWDAASNWISRPSMEDASRPDPGTRTDQAMIFGKLKQQQVPIAPAIWSFGGFGQLNPNPPNPAINDKQSDVWRIASLDVVAQLPAPHTVDWNFTPLRTPNASVHQAAAYDSHRGIFLMMTGNEVGRISKTIHEFDGSSWRDLETPVGLAERESAAMAYDADRGVFVLFGGFNGGYLNDTWEFDGTLWTQVQPVTTPPKRRDHSMVFDEKRHRILMVGGRSDATEFDDSWEWTGADWRQITTARIPGGRDRFALAYNAALGNTVLFGGSSGLALHSDTWLLDGDRWVELQADNATGDRPRARRDVKMSYDPVLRQIVVFGGETASQGAFFDTWQMSVTCNNANNTCVSWQRIMTPTAPSARFGSAMAYDGQLGKTLLFGGYVPGEDGLSAEMWAFDYANLDDQADRCIDATVDTDGDGLYGCADPDCWGRCTPTCPPMSSCPVSGPRCGDGICNDFLEDLLLCPRDCTP